MWMHTSRRIQAAWLGLGQYGRVNAALIGAAGDDYFRDTGLTRAPYHLGAIVIETVMCKIGSNINQRIGHFRSLLQPFGGWGYLNSTYSTG